MFFRNIFFKRLPPTKTFSKRKQNPFKTASIIGGSSLFLGIYYYNHLDIVPISGRKRFIAISRKFEEEMGERTFNSVMDTYKYQILHSFDPRTVKVYKVTNNLLGVLNEEEKERFKNYKIYVVDDDNELNAFVLPGGKIFVFTGILKIMENDDELASVLGHEISHQLARHSAESMTRILVLEWLKVLMSFVLDYNFTAIDGLIKELFLTLPHSRQCESEADYMGLLIMSKACYDPRKATDFWNKMAKMNEDKELPQFLSTHPVKSTRIKDINSWMDEAMKKYRENGCSEYKAFFYHF